MRKLELAAEAVADADVAITEAAGDRRDWLPVRALSRFAKLGDQPELRLISAALFATGVVLGRSRLRRAGVRMIAAHELATLAKNVAKDNIDRTRPRSAASSREAEPEPGTASAKEHTSFPSGHSAGAVAVARAFAREFPEYRAAALATAGLVAVGQVPKCAHYPTDIVAGAALGVASEAALAAMWPVDADTRP